MNDPCGFMDGLYSRFMPKAAKAGEDLPDDALVLGVDPESGAKLYVTMRDLATSMLIAGGTNSGKSNAIRRLLRGLLRRAKRFGEGFAVVDVGNVASWLLQAIAQSYPELAPRVFYADLCQRSGKVLGFDLLSGGAARRHFTAASAVEVLMRTVGGHGTTERVLVARTLYQLLAALIDLKLPLTDARFFLARDPRARLVLQNQLARLPEASPVRSFWEDLALKPPSVFDSYVIGPANRVSPLILAPPVRRMVAGSSPSVSLDLLRLMDEGGIGIFNLAREDADVTPDGQLSLAGLICHAFRQRFEERKADRSKPFTLVLDEAGLYLAGLKDFAELVLFAARKYNLRLVLACQALSQFTPLDGSRVLYDAALSIPTKLILGNLPFATDCKVLGEEMYLRSIDPMKVKNQATRIVWDPVLKKVVVHNYSEGGGVTHHRSTTTTKTRGKHHARADVDTLTDGVSAARSVPDVPGAGPTTIDGTQTIHAIGTVLTDGESELESKARQRGTSLQTNWSQGTSEQWITEHAMRTEELPPQFSPLDEQVFLAGRHLKLSARGHGVLLRPGQEPVDIRIDHEPDIELGREDMEAFLEEVFAKECYSPAEEIDRLLDEREQRILAEATRGPRVIGSTSGRKKAKEETPVPTGLFQDAQEE